MKKILFLLLICQGLTAQVIFEASINRQLVLVGQRVSVTFKINRISMDDFKFLGIDGFKIISGPAMEQIIEWKEGIKMVQYTATYILLAEKAGKHVLPEATATFEGKTYKTSPLKITVSNYREIRDSLHAEFRKRVFIKGVLSKNDLHVSEPVELTYMLYIGQYAACDRIEELEFKNDDFNVKKLESIDTVGTKEIINGKGYRVFTVGRFELTPKKTGNLTISPYKVETIGDILITKENEEPRQHTQEKIVINAEAIPVKVKE